MKISIEIQNAAADKNTMDYEWVWTMIMRAVILLLLVTCCVFMCSFTSKGSADRAMRTDVIAMMILLMILLELLDLIALNISIHSRPSFHMHDVVDE